jgi:hypothetical protein
MDQISDRISEMPEDLQIYLAGIGELTRIPASEQPPPDVRSERISAGSHNMTAFYPTSSDGNTAFPRPVGMPIIVVTIYPGGQYR